MPRPNPPRLITLLLTALIASACGGGSNETRDLTFGPGATASASGILDGCESVTPNGEFSGQLWLEIDGAETPLENLDHLPLGNNETATLAFEEKVEGVEVGTEICIRTVNMEEDDTFSDDEMSNDTNCQKLKSTTRTLTFALRVQKGGCALDFWIPMTVAGDTAASSDTDAAEAQD